MISAFNTSFRRWYRQKSRFYFNPKKKTLLLVATSISLNIFSLILPIAMLHFYENVLPDQSVSAMVMVCLAVIVAVCLEAILRFSRSYITLWSSAFFEHDLGCRAMERFIYADTRKMQFKGSGFYLKYMAGISKLKDISSGEFLQQAIDFGFVFIFLGFIYYIAGALVLVPMVFLCAFIISLYLMTKNVVVNLHSKDNADDTRYNFIIESLRGIQTIKSLGLEPVFARRYEQLKQASSDATQTVGVRMSLVRNFTAMFNQFMIMASVFAGALMVLNGSVTMGALVAAVLLIGRILSPIQSGMQLWFKWQDVSVAEEGVCSMLNLPQIKRDNAAIDIAKKGDVTISNLHFRYKDADKDIIDGVNLYLKAGNVISISGDFVSGKTTFLKLLAGVLVPTYGSVKIDDIEVSHYPDDEIGRHVAYLSSDSPIFKGTILDNLTGFAGSAYAQRAIEIVKLLGADAEIAKLADGYQTQLRDTNSDAISIGLKQRIAMVRVLLQKPKVILFDNADKSLDTQGYNRVVELFSKLAGKATIIMVSNDRNILRLAHREYVLEGGKLNERAFDVDSKFYDVKPYETITL